MNKNSQLYASHRAKLVESGEAILNEPPDKDQPLVVVGNTEEQRIRQLIYDACEEQRVICARIYRVQHDPEFVSVRGVTQDILTAHSPSEDWIAKRLKIKTQSL